MKVYDSSRIEDDDLGVGYEFYNSVDEVLQNQEDEWEDSDNEELDTASAAMQNEQLDDSSAERMQTGEDTLNPASIEARKRQSEAIDDNEDEAETIIVRKRHRSAPEVGATAALGPVPDYPAVSCKGRGKYVSLSAWSKEERIAATLLVQDNTGISVNELFEWYRALAAPLSLMELHKADLEAAVELNPRISSRQLAAVLGIPRASARHMCKELGYRRYKIRPVQMLSAKNKSDRLACAQNFLKRP
ncbi:unnamed protein product, partial [Mesorhabditis spiculigera]